MLEHYVWPEAGDEPVLRLNLILSADGYSDVDGVSGPLGNDDDRDLFLGLRRSCDAIVVGARTALAEEYSAPAEAPLVLLSRSLDLPTEGDLVGTEDRPTEILAPLSAPQQHPDAWKRLEKAGYRLHAVLGEEAPATDCRWWCANQGYRRVLCEGGLSWARSLARAGVLDEVCLTRAPIQAAGRATGERVEVGELCGNLHRIHALRRGEYVFERWTRRGESSAHRLR